MKKLGLLLCALAIHGLLNSQTPNSAENSDADALAKQLQNPIASLISVPFQFNFDFGVGPSDGSRMTLNIQPVIPISISEDWNLIGRIILPVISQNDVFGNSGNQFGVSDAVVSGFFSPKAPTSGGLIWGAGPVLLVPTATDRLLGSEKFGIGPTAVILKQAGSLTFGGLINHIWSVAGSKERADVNATFFQPFLAKNFTGGYALALNTELTYNWDNNTTSGNLHLIGSKVFTIGKQMTQFILGPRIPYGNGNTAKWGIRTGFVLLFPK
ncbi:hypothetical protein [Algibacter mikhailovii]|uniref:Transporter n=1 Tax=Algibacter mikhailovii TaxID=425498 RepID=A0A918VCQ1_9FLAO|nr:hypothetical protein [Algibacter mikhailovii]GGZ89612.1 hypothetical protein GCM10007028_29900 [Algibacter mikhailovii]